MKLHKAVLVVALLASMVIVGLLLPVRAWFAEFEAYVHSLGAIGPAIYALGYVVLTVLLFPASFVTLGAGTLFGLKTGLFVALAGANLGALCSFLLARTFLRQKVMHWTAPYPKFRFLDEAIGKQGFKMVLLCRLSPIFPFILLNYFLGLTAVRTAAYVMANMLGMLPAMFLFVYIGATARAALEVQPTATDFYQQILKYLGLAATVLLLVVVTRIARKALREAEQALEGGGVDKAHIDENHEPTPFDKMVSVEDPRDQQLIQNCRPPGWINPVPAKKYNLVVIGGGTAGLVSAAGAAGLGARVALIERNLLGGDCLNVGCVPSKGIIRAARAAGDARGGGEFGITPPGEAEINFSAVMERMRRLRADISAHDSVERFTQLGVDVFIGNGRFVGPNRIEVADQELKFDRAVIASGARAAEPPISGLRDAGFYTNETIFTLTELPRRLAVIGAGPLGCELAQCFQRLGSRVTLITDGAAILPRENRDAAQIVHRQMEKDGVRIIAGANIQRAEIRDGAKNLTLTAADQPFAIACDAILVSVGRTPNVENLGLEAAGIRYSARGVEVDERLRTTNRRVFAAGDICSRYKFTHAADAMARIVIANALFFARRKVTDLVIPWCTYTDPEVAHVGFHEKDARAAGFDVATITQTLSEVDRAVLDGETAGFGRVHYDKKTGKILGGTIVARHAGEMLGELTLAMVAKQRVGVLSSTIHSYPTQVEALRKIGDAYMKTKLTLPVKKIFEKWLAWRCS
jgi:pyruvate/2-oxoglutarate dehydrogenase complex dihydrolipoamide dehydrogenase (E3) component/uncharacterized membrane protein YdjX (TVP38/TMEM64 family)